MAKDVDLATHPFDDIADVRVQTSDWTELNRRAGVDDDTTHDFKRTPEYWAS